MSLAATGEEHLVPLVEFWRGRLTRLRRLFHDLGGDIVSAFRSLEESGRIETITSAATHGFLPLLARDESIRLQLAVGRAEHRRLFGRLPQGIWVPECAYRPRGPWQPWSSAPRSGVRRGIEEHLGDAGFRFFFVDSHLASAGRPLGIYGDPATRAVVQRSGNRTDGLGHRSPYRSYEVAPWRGGRHRRAWCGTRARPCRSGAGSMAILATAPTSSSTRCAGPADSSSGG